MEQHPELSRTRVKKIFEYLRALNELRNPVTRLVSDHQWHLWLRNLPVHECITCTYRQDDKEDQEEHPGPFSLTVDRPVLTQVPPPPEAIKDWLAPGWDSVEGEVKVHGTRSEEGMLPGSNKADAIKFEKNPERIRLLESWSEERDAWAICERPTRAVNKLFERLYDLYTTLERESEKYELILGNGILNQHLPQGGVHHPILLQRVNLTFDAKKPAFTITETDDDVALYSALFRLLPGADATMIRQRREELEQGLYHPLGGSDTAGFFKSIVNSIGSKGSYVSEGPLNGEQADPRLVNDPIIFTRNRSQGFAAGLERILGGMDERKILPDSLVRIAGVDGAIEEKKASETQKTLSATDILLTKPTNAEQVKIAQQLASHGAVIVQGPPGTGKTHTIANLIGHLLSEGKRVLVTSHTSKALLRVREQLVEPLQSLCVSVLGSDAKSREELKRSIDSIANRIASNNAEDLEKQADLLTNRRNTVLKHIEDLRQQLLAARTSEYAEIVIGGKGYAPKSAAQNILKERETHGWIPSPITPGAPCPLSPDEVRLLYQTNHAVTKELESELDAGLPDPQSIPSPDTFTKWISDIKQLKASSIEVGESYWQRESPVSVKKLVHLGKEIHRALRMVQTKQPWRLELLDAGRTGAGRQEPWKKLISLIAEVNKFANAIQEQLITHAPKLAPSIPVHDQHRVLTEIVAHLRTKNKIGKTKLLVQREWAGLIGQVQVERGVPKRAEEFRALASLAELHLKRRQLVSRWDRLVSQRGGLAIDRLGERPERTLLQQGKQIEIALNWYKQIWLPRYKALLKAGFNWKAWVEATPLPVHEFAELLRLQLASTKLGELIKAEIGRRYIQNIEEKLGDIENYLTDCAQTSSSLLLKNIYANIHALDHENYRRWHGQLMKALQRKPILKRRRMLLAKLAKSAKTWAKAMQHRIAPHDQKEPPGNVENAWLWRQLNDELDRRGSLSMDDLQRKIEKATSELQEITGELVEKKAWATQITRLRNDLARQQALIGWRDTMRRIGAGTGKRVARLRSEARKLMKQCKTAVPVWVMPLTGVVENFDPTDTQFDVVIIDEASQVDVMGLVALYMAKSVVVVGDHEQVSPSAVGQVTESVEYLIDEHLQGIPNKMLYDGKASVYELARQSFGGGIGLWEHFRCVPDIIQFSNALSYGSKIRPLRDASQVTVAPAVIAHRVGHAYVENKINKNEAAEVAALLIAASEQPEYEGMTFGVISMVGERQAKLIGEILRTHLTPVQYEHELNIQCGNPAHFQGDERDVMFLSMVDTSDSGPLPLRTTDGFKQRFNVAASRARDQMWVVYSLDHKTALKEGDLRRRLIEHALDPGALAGEIERTAQQTDSAFERMVLHQLMNRGYRVIPQWKVGAYRIDLVVEGSDGKKLAVECDGDRYHPPEKLSEDMARQAILERLGWTFARIRGSVFFRDPDAAMQPVFERLAELEIHPVPDESVDEEKKPESELVDRVRRRAAALRSAWTAGGEAQKSQATNNTPKSKTSSLNLLDAKNGISLDRLSQN